MPEKKDQNSDAGLFNSVEKETPSKRRAVIYIDGFNFYNGSIKGTDHKWLNLQKYFDLLRQHDDVVRIRYFTAQMSGPSGDRQSIYLRALATLPRVEVVLGKYKRTTLKCKVSSCSYTGDKTVPQV